MSLPRAITLLVLVTGCSQSVAQPAAPAATSRPAPQPVFATADDVRQVQATAPIPIEEPELVSPLPNEPRLPASLAGLDFGRPMTDTASGCLVPPEPLSYEGIKGETTRCANAPARVGHSTPEVVLYALHGTVNGMMFTYPTWQSAVALIPEAYGAPTITEGEDEQEHEVEDFRGEKTRTVAWEVENGRVVLFFNDAWRLLFAYRG